MTAIAVASLIAGPASADPVEITCSGSNPFVGTPIPSTDGDVKLVGDDLRACTLAAGDYVNGNVIVTGKVRSGVLGTIWGNIKVDTDHGLTLPMPTNIPNAVLVSRGVVTGNIIQEGNGDIRLGVDAWVFGNLEMKGTGRIIVGANARFPFSVITVGGNVVNEGPGCIFVFTRGAGAVKNTVNIAGNVESKGGGGGQVSPAPAGFPGSSGCEDVPFTLPPDGGRITIDGNICSDGDDVVVVDPLNTGLVVADNIRTSCARGRPGRP